MIYLLNKNMRIKSVRLAHVLIQIVHFKPLEVVGRGSETQLQVVKKTNV